jgi:hypothetical protein
MRMFNVRWHGINTVEVAFWMRRREDRSRYTLAATQVAKRKPAIACRRAKPRYDGDVIKPGGRQFVKKRPQIGDVGRIANSLQDHRSASARLYQFFVGIESGATSHSPDFKRNRSLTLIREKYVTC